MSINREIQQWLQHGTVTKQNDQGCLILAIGRNYSAVAEVIASSIKAQYFLLAPEEAVSSALKGNMPSVSKALLLADASDVADADIAMLRDQIGEVALLLREAADQDLERYISLGFTVRAYSSEALESEELSGGYLQHWPAVDSLAVAGEEGGPKSKLAWCTFSIASYKVTPDWLNAKGWANPNMWDKHRW